MELGIIGLGKMGGNLALNANDQGIKVVGKTRGDRPDLKKEGVEIVKEYDSFVSSLSTPRVIYLSLPAGETIDIVLGELTSHLDKGDIIMDGGNSYFRDSIRREKELKKKGIYLLDCGTSGGIDGARSGACFMVGGDEKAFKIAEPILNAVAIKEGLVHTGAAGTGHYVKLVHNGIEFGMLQSIGEGVELMENSEFELDLASIFHNWSHGSVIRSWLVELMEKGLNDKGELTKISDHVDDTGEVNWLIHEAIEDEVPIPVITQSIFELFKSRKKPEEAYRAIALMRHGFGGHPFGHSDYIAKERKTSRVGKI